MSNRNLFNEFNIVSSKEWKQKIQADLKGADYNDTLIWKTNEGINVKPFYHADEPDYSPNKVNSKASQWNICQSIYVLNEKVANKKAINILGKGAEAIQFILPSEDVSIKAILNNIELSKTPVYFKPEFLSSSFIKKLNNYASNNKSLFYVNTDIIGNLAKTGNWFYNLKEDHKLIENLVENSSSIKSVLGIDLTLYQNAGANIIQQLAYTLAHANEYLNHFNKNINTITFNVSVGTNYFFEIAKLRALRLLWDTLKTEYNISNDCHIVAIPTKRNKTLYDYNTNMLRTTTECMSAILGGANTVLNIPYDAIYHKDNEFGERISRNQLLVLKNESYFNKVNNPAEGSYYIENLTNQLAEKSLDLFKDIERNGGFLKQLKEGTIQRKIKESADSEQTQFDNSEIELLGTNIHPNLNDKMKNDLELYPFVKTKTRKTLIEPIIEKRLAEKIEQERLKTE